MQDNSDSVDDILVVDDNPADRRFIQEAFQKSSLDPTIHTASTQDEALAFLSRWQNEDGSPNPALVLLDWNLAQTTGADVLEAAKSSAHDILVIVMTGSDPERSALEPPVEMADKVIKKPTDPADYIEYVQSVLDTR